MYDRVKSERYKHSATFKVKNMLMLCTSGEQKGKISEAFFTGELPMIKPH